jgi:subtilisin family serine protease
VTKELVLPIRSIASWFAVILISSGMLVESTFASDDSERRRRVAPQYDELMEVAQRRQVVPVIVRFKVDAPDGRSLSNRREAGRNRLRDSMSQLGIHSFAEFRRSGLSSFFVSPQQLQQLVGSEFVVTVVESRLRQAHMFQSNLLTHAKVARDNGLRGAGAAVVVLDTGIDADHPTFDDRVVWEACYSTNSTSYRATNLCPAGGNKNFTQYFQAGPGAAALTKCTDVNCFHGTHVSSIAAGSDATNTGVAPAADIIAIQVFSRFDDDNFCGVGRSPCILSFDHDQLSALEYVADIAASYNVASVNMSLGGGRFYSPCDAISDFPAIIAELENLDVIVAASSGNNGYSDSLGHPACVTKVVSVGSVTDTDDSISAFSNSASFLDLLAPGKGITAAYPGGGSATFNGTSMASPHIAGAAALLKGADINITHADMKSMVTATGDVLLDSRNGLSFPRLNLGLLTQAMVGGVRGDANDDGHVDGLDLMLLKLHVSGGPQLSAPAALRCDLYPDTSPDGVLNVSDSLALQMLVLAP